MTHDGDIERILETWFTDGPTETPDRVLKDVTSRIHRQRQRPGWRLTWRQAPMNAYLKPIVALAAVVVVLVAGVTVLGRPSGVAAPSAVPATPGASAAPSPAPTESPVSSAAAAAFCDTDRPCDGPLTAGDHSPARFLVPFTFATPDGWINNVDIDRSYALRTQGGIATDIAVWANVAIPQQTTACDTLANAGAGRTVQDFVDFLTTHPGLDTSQPVPVTIGGFSGQRVDFSVASSWTQLCPPAGSGPSVFALTDTGTPPERQVVYTPDDRVRWSILDVAGTTVVIAEKGSSYGSTFDSAIAATQPIIDSIRFTPTR